MAISHQIQGTTLACRGIRTCENGPNEDAKFSPTWFRQEPITHVILILLTESPVGGKAF